MITSPARQDCRFQVQDLDYDNTTQVVCRHPTDDRFIGFIAWIIPKAQRSVWLLDALHEQAYLFMLRDLGNYNRTVERDGNT